MVFKLHLNRYAKSIKAGVYMPEWYNTTGIRFGLVHASSPVLVERIGKVLQKKNFFL